MKLLTHLPSIMIFISCGYAVNEDEMNRRVSKLNGINSEMAQLLKLALTEYETGITATEIKKRHEKEIVELHTQLNLELADMTRYCMEQRFPQEIQFKYLENLDLGASQKLVRELKEVGISFEFEKFE